MIPRESPRWLEVDLGALTAGARVPLERCARRWSAPQAALARIGAWSGPALALALLHERAHGDPAPLVLAVGECVRRGLPTAARATVAARAPLSGLYAEGQVGSDLARRLAGVADALLLCGRVRAGQAGRGAVLVVEHDGVRLEHVAGLAGLAPRASHAQLERTLGPCATLAVGPAGERGSPLANLAACSSGGGADAVPHFVGRGGLGAVLGALGLKAVAVLAPPVAERADPELTQLLLRSPRLAARAQGGTLELFETAAAAGESIERADARAVASAVAATPREPHGCRGCPTPCGWSFAGLAGLQSARFGATRALGVDLGLARLEDALALLARCDELGLDAKEAGAVLALRAGAYDARGDRAAYERALDQLARCEGAGARGAAQLARELGVVGAIVKGQAARASANLAALLGQCVASRGADPMRSFPFLASDGAEELLAELAAPLPIPPGSADPADPAGKGRLVWWHEALAAALDLTGFCAFSAAGLLADGVCTLDELAQRIAPRALLDETGADGPGWRLVGAGDALVSLARAYNVRLGAAPRADRPAFARAALERPGMWDEYAALRALDDEGRERASPALWAAPFDLAGRLAAADLPAQTVATADGGSGAGPRRPGRVTLLAGAALALHLGAERELALELPARLDEVLRAAAHAAPGSDALLFSGGRPLPAVFRNGRRVARGALVRDGDRLDLVLSIAGG